MLQLTITGDVLHDLGDCVSYVADAQLAGDISSAAVIKRPGALVHVERKANGKALQ